MKKPAMIMIATFLSFGAIGQPTLTQGFNEPSIGNTFHYAVCDSIASIPRSTGNGQYWDFSSIVVSTPGWTTQPLAHTYSYTSPAGKPGAASFPAATMAEGTGVYYNYFRSVASPGQQLELLGTKVGGSTLVLSDPKVVMKWPIGFGTSYTDTYSGTVNGNPSAMHTGTISVNASGSGTLELPGGQIFHNVLQVKTTEYTSIAGQFGMAYAPEKFDYYISGTGEPLLSVIKMDHIGTDTVMIMWNQSVVTSLKEIQDHGFVFYPNPARDRILISPGKVAAVPREIKLLETSGRLVKSKILPAGATSTGIELTGLVPGVYLLQMDSGEGISPKKLIIH